jgi:hypothetical protein
MTLVMMRVSDSPVAAVARRAWARFEPIHDVVYFSAHTKPTTEALGLRGFWMGYFAMRLAPLGMLGPVAAAAVCYGFHPRRIARALPDAWNYVDAHAALRAREHIADRSLQELIPDGLGTDHLVEAAELAWRAARAIDLPGRALGAANVALEPSTIPRIALWQATTVLREHRGDTHNAVLLANGIAAAEAHLIKAGAGEADGETLRTGRGFAQDEWDDARARLRARGVLDANDRLTPDARELHLHVERVTDEQSSAPWHRLGATDSERLISLLDPIALAIRDRGLLPATNPVGLTSV